jgi:cytochrome c peroxidase
MTKSVVVVAFALAILAYAEDATDDRIKLLVRDRKASQAELGRKLFHDPILSANGKVACATCHIPDRGYTSYGKPLDYVDGSASRRRAPSVIGVAGNKLFDWDARTTTLEAKVLQPITHPKEMGYPTLDAALARVKETYPTITSSAELAHALGTFLTTLTHPRTRWDDYLAGSGNLSADELRGFELFRGKAECYRCHTGTAFTDNKTHNTGVGIVQRKDGTRYTYDLGRKEVTKEDMDTCAFKTPGLRGCKVAGPYMHDASLKTLRDVIDFYDLGGFANVHLDKHIRPLQLTEQQKADLLAFLEAL